MLQVDRRRPPRRSEKARSASPDLIDSIDLPVVMVGRDTAVVRYNAAAAALLSLTPSDIGRPLRGVRALRGMHDLDDACAYAFKGGASTQHEIRDGNGSSFLVRVLPYLGRGLQIEGAVLTLTNVTSLRASIAQAIREREYAKEIINTVAHSLVVLDAELKVRTANRAFYAMFQLSRTETEGIRLIGENAPWDVPRLKGLLVDILSKGLPLQSLEVAHEFPGIGRRTMLVQANGLSRERTLPHLILLSIEDISERKRAEEKLLETDRRKTEFLAMLAHELRNPLAPIRNALQIMRLTGGDAPSTATIDMMDRQVRQLIRLVDDLLDISRISLGRIALKREHIDLASAVSRAVESVRPLCDGLDQELTVELPPKPAYLNADRARLAQIIGNLLSNASKFTGRGGRVGLSVEPEDKEIVIRVRDTGIGIGPGQLPRIFEMFYQADTPHSQGGLGIGLTLVKNLVEMHDGTVEARSGGAGHGSEFVVRLPVLPGPPPPAAAETSRRVGQSATLPMRVLLVEDNRDVADSLALLLELNGYEIDVARDGRAGVDAAARFRPDVILLDIGLPDLDGYEVARRIRSHKGNTNPVIVALTGWGQAGDRLRSRDAGFDAHLVKPVDPESLTKVIDELGASKPARKAALAIRRHGSPARPASARGAATRSASRPSTHPAGAAGPTVDDPQAARAGTWRDIFHDLQGSVAGVAFATSLLEREDLPESRRHEFVDLLRRGVSYLQEMLNDLMGLARLETGEERPRVGRFDAGTMLTDFCAMSQPLVRTRGLSLKADGPGSLPVEGDRLKIQRILQNLLLHALRGTRHSGVRIAWRGAGRRDTVRWMFSVTAESRVDTAAETPARARPPQPAGEGISLSIVKRLCEVLDADLDLEFNPNEGTTFRVSLPLRYDTAPK